MESSDQPSTVSSEAAQARQDAERKEAFRNLRHWRVLIGTAGTWFLFDVAFYGTVIFQPTILENVFGEGQSLEGLAGHAVMMCALGSLGLLAGLFALRYISAKALNTAGLASGGCIYLMLMLLFQYRPDASNLLFGAYTSC